MELLGPLFSISSPWLQAQQERASYQFWARVLIPITLAPQYREFLRGRVSISSLNRLFTSNGSPFWAPQENDTCTGIHHRVMVPINNYPSQAPQQGGGCIGMNHRSWRHLSIGLFFMHLWLKATCSTMTSVGIGSSLGLGNGLVYLFEVCFSNYFLIHLAWIHTHQFQLPRW